MRGSLVYVVAVVVQAVYGTCPFKLDWQYFTTKNVLENKIYCHLGLPFNDHKDCLADVRIITRSQAASATPESLKTMLLNGNHIKFYLLTRELQRTRFGIPVRFDPRYHLRYLKRYFHIGEKTVVMIHDYRDTWERNNAITPLVANEYLQKFDVNIIMVDWRTLANPRLYPSFSRAALTPDYGLAKANTKIVGEVVAEMMVQLRQDGILTHDCFTHLIGDGLGAHIMGIVGHLLNSKYKIGVGRISGLDPYGPCFRKEKNEFKLDKSDANFVDVTHTSGLVDCTAMYQRAKYYYAFPASSLYSLCATTPTPGINESIGHVDFYYNGGYVPQPNCENDELNFLLGRCSHAYGGVFFKNIEPPVYLRACDRLDDCHDNVPMGYFHSEEYRGELFISTPTCGFDVDV